MRIAFLIPPTSYDFFRALVPYLQAVGHEVEVNQGVKNADVLLAAMLPQTAEWGPVVEAHAERAIVWHWDQFSFVDYTAGGWMSRDVRCKAFVSGFPALVSPLAPGYLPRPLRGRARRAVIQLRPGGTSGQQRSDHRPSARGS